MHLHRIEALREEAGEGDRPGRGAALRLRCERGASAIEYALLLALIAVVALSAVSFLGKSTGGNIKRSGDCLSAAYENQPKPAGCP